MDPQTVLRFVKTLGAWPGKVVVVACEPAEVEEMGLGLSAEVERAVDGAVDLVIETIEELRTDAAYAVGLSHARAVALRRDREHRRQARGGAAGERRRPCASARCARSCRTRSTSTSASSSKGTVCEGARLEQELIPARAALRDLRARVGDRRCRIFMCPDCGGAGQVEVASGNEFEVESIEVEEAECIAPR